MFKSNKKMSAGSARAEAIMWILAASFLLVIIGTGFWMYFLQGIN